MIKSTNRGVYENEARLILFGRTLAFVPYCHVVPWLVISLFFSQSLSYIHPSSKPQPASHPTASILRIDSSLSFWWEICLSHLWPFFFCPQKCAFHSAMQHHSLVIFSCGSSSHPIEKRYLINSALEALLVFLSFIIAVLL